MSEKLLAASLRLADLSTLLYFLLDVLIRARIGVGGGFRLPSDTFAPSKQPNSAFLGGSADSITCVRFFWVAFYEFQ
jgi:hypothetical protein